MHDLNTLNRLNAEAHAAAMTRVRATGKHVVAHYAGLTLMSFRSFETLEEAVAHQTGAVEASEHRSILGPLPSFAGSSRDQSEDRAQPRNLAELAALGARSVGDPAVV